jgi:uncharacterized protein
VTTPANPGTGNLQGITEADIANYLANNPAFFERHAELLSSVQLTSPHGQRAVSLQERQMEMLRERIKGLEHKIMEMVRNSQDNVALFDRLHRFTRSALAAHEGAALADGMVASLKHEFMIPQVALRLWGVDPAHASLPAAQPVSDDVKSFATSLTLPYCGANSGFEASEWLDDAGTVTSMAMVPLRQGDTAYGLLVLGSPDPTRYTASMGTEFLVRIGEIASAGLARLRAAG